MSINSIDGAIRSLNASLNTLEGVRSTLEKESPGGKGTYINVRPGGTEEIPTFGPTKVFTSLLLETAFQGKNATNNMATIKSIITNRLREDPRRGQNAQETIIGPWEPQDDIGRDGVVETLTVIIRTEDAGCK